MEEFKGGGRIQGDTNLGRELSQLVGPLLCSLSTQMATILCDIFHSGSMRPKVAAGIFGFGGKWEGDKDGKKDKKLWENVEGKYLIC
jgi:hypothetical protein